MTKHTEYDDQAIGAIALGNLVTEAFFHPDPRDWEALQPVLDRMWSRQPRRDGQGSRRPSHLQVKREAANRVLAKLHPNGIPDMATLPNKHLCSAVARDMPYSVSDETILRAAGRKR